MKSTWSSSGEHRFTGFQVIRDRSRDWGSSVRSQWGRTSTSFHIFTIVHHKSMVFYVRFFLKANFERNEKSNYHNFGPLEVSITTKYRSDPWPNVLSHILIEIQSLLTLNVTRLSSTEHIWPILTHFERIQWKKWSENIILINITIFWEWNMSNHVSLHEETEFDGDRYDSFLCIVSFCDWPASLEFSTTPCMHDL